ncbi:MAG: hypothetical protein GY819_08425 [Planctomycetaceae bacterium]|nr:hypothetical protein [Planctomycetaceae bacterium]
MSLTSIFAWQFLLLGGSLDIAFAVTLKNELRDEHDLAASRHAYTFENAGVKPLLGAL